MAPGAPCYLPRSAAITGVKMNDWHLLEEWSRDGSETAFAGLVERHVALVYSAARRQVYGDAALAEEVTQQTFCLLSRKAGTLRPGGSLASWLYQTAGNVARERLRTERRRRLREQQAVDWDSAAIDSMTNPTPAPTWETVAPVLDSALGQLSTADRAALVARFFERRSMRELGTVLGVSEDAAKVRVSRAIKRLRDLLARAGICATADVLAGLLSEHAVVGVPEGIQASVLQAVKLRGTVIGAGAGWGERLARWTQSPLRVVAVGLGLAVGGLLVERLALPGGLFSRSAKAESGEGLAAGTGVPIPDATARSKSADSSSSPAPRSAESLEEARAALRGIIMGEWPDNRLPEAGIRRALALFGHDRRLAVPILLEFLRAPIGVGSVTAQASAAFALRQLGVDGADAVPELLVLLRQRQLILIAPELGTLFPALQPSAAPILPTLIEIFAQAHQSMGNDGINAILAAYAWADPDAMAPYRPALAHLLKHEDPDIRRNAALTLAGFPGAKETLVIDQLTETLALGRLRDPQAYAPIHRGSDTISQDGLRQDDGLWRRGAVAALGQCGESARTAVPVLKEIAELSPTADPLRTEALVALGRIDPTLRETDAEVDRLIAARDRSAELKMRAESRTATPAELAEGLAHASSATASVDALLESPVEEVRTDAIMSALVESLRSGVDSGYPATRALKHLAPEELLNTLRRHDYTSLPAIAVTLGDMGLSMAAAAPLLEAALEQIPAKDYTTLEAVAEAIQKIEPKHRRLVFDSGALEAANAAFVKEVYAQGKGQSPIFSVYIEQIMNRQVVTRTQLLAFVDATRTEPILHDAFVTGLAAKNPDLAADLGRPKP